jgi:hypothetical protein
MVEDILKRFPTDETWRLSVLLSSWVDNNKKHAKKFSKWVDEANSLEDNPIYMSALQAAQEVGKANEQLW